MHFLIIIVIMTFLPNHNEFLTIRFYGYFDFIKVRPVKKKRVQMSFLSLIKAQTWFF
jgi:hypothetical protein